MGGIYLATLPKTWVFAALLPRMLDVCGTRHVVRSVHALDEDPQNAGIFQHGCISVRCPKCWYVICSVFASLYSKSKYFEDRASQVSKTSLCAVFCAIDHESLVAVVMLRTRPANTTRKNLELSTFSGIQLQNDTGKTRRATMHGDTILPPHRHGARSMKIGYNSDS